jgi:hypothetical protein
VAATTATVAAAQAARAISGSTGTASASSASTAMPASRGHGTIRHTAYLNAACPARNSAGPPRISQAYGAVATDDGRVRIFSSLAAVTMIPATITGWMRW